MNISISTAEVRRIPIERAKQAILLPATIGGQHVDLLFDNGSSATVIDETLARDSGLKLTPSTSGLNTGRSTLPTKKVDATIIVGDALTITGQVVAADLQPMSRALGRRVAGIIGADALSAFIVVINPAGGWIAFGVPGHLSTDSRPRATGASAAGLKDLAGSAARMPTIIPLGLDYGIDATINGNPVRLEIDYGSVGAVTLRDDIWRRVIPPDARSGQVSSSTRADGLPIAEQVGTAKELTFGTATVRNVPAVSQAASDRIRYEGLLGLAVLGSTTTILDNPKRRLWLFPADQDVAVYATGDRPNSSSRAVP